MANYAFQTPRLWLEKFSVEDHLDDFHELWDKPDALLWSSHGIKKTKEEALAWMLFVMPSPINPDIDKYAFLLRPNPEPHLNAQGRPKMIGMVGTNRYSNEGLEVGYCVNLDYWGKGYAGEAFRGFLEMYWGLEERKEVKQLVAKVDPENVASQKIIVRAGARKGGVLKDWYSRSIDNGVKRDIDFWFIDRPGVTEGELGVWGEEVKRLMVRKNELEKEKEEKERLERKTNEGE